LCRSCHAWGQEQALGLGGTQHFGVTVRHHDDLSTGFFDLAHLLRGQHGACANQAIGGQALTQQTDAVVRLRGIERNFNDAKTGGVQDVTDRRGFFGAQAAQNRDQTVLREGLFEHLSSLREGAGQRPQKWMKSDRPGPRPATGLVRWPVRPASPVGSHWRRVRADSAPATGRCRSESPTADRSRAGAATGSTPRFRGRSADRTDNRVARYRPSRR
nr:hypothetical protein [Tanacetum cinerariifolium]